MRFTVSCEGRITEDDGTALAPDELESILDAVMEQMETLEGIEDPDINATLVTGQVRLSVDVAGQPSEAAYVLGSRRIRAALHAAMIATPGWEDAESAQLTKSRGSIKADQITVRRQLVDA